VSSAATRTEVDAFLARLIEDELAIFATAVVDSGGVVTWPQPTGYARFLLDPSTPSIKDYRWWVSNGMYSAMLTDGSLLQITYAYDHNYLLSHRLAYVPCPFTIPAEELQSDPLIETFDRYASKGADVVLPRSMIRFDYDRHGQGVGHPAAHLTVNSLDCRVPCAAPLRLGRFVAFVFRHFYPGTAAKYPWVMGMPAGPLVEHTISEHERSETHIYWPR